MKFEETPKQMIQRVVRVAKILVEGTQKQAVQDAQNSTKSVKNPQKRKTV